MMRQSKTLAASLRRAGLSLSPAQALDAVARMQGLPSWQAALKTGGVGAWSAAQLAVHRAFPGSEAFPVKPGGPYVGRASLLYEALMHLARAQPRTRLLKTLEHWAGQADQLQQGVRDALLIDEPFAPCKLVLPKGLAATFQAFLAGELQDPALASWGELGQRLERLRGALYAVQAGLLAQGPVPPLHATLLLDSLHGSPLPLGVPLPLPAGEAYALAERVIGALHARAAEVADGLFVVSEGELKVHLVQAGFVLLAPGLPGPIWD
jgi:hypothetical protein